MIKSGVDVRGIQPEILLAVQEAREVYRKYGATFVITSCKEGNHRPFSKHFEGLAIDLRTRNLDDKDKAPIAEAINRALGPQYDVVLESDHIHVEFDPKD